MKKEERNILLVIAVVAIVAVSVFSFYLIPGDSFTRTKVYYEPTGGFSMQVPSSFGIQREKISESETILKVVAPNDVASANPGLINIVVFKGSEDSSLKKQASAFLSVSEDRMVDYASQTPAYSYVSQNAQEISYYYFMQNGDYVIAYKFNKSYFDKSNPLILVDNSLYANAALRTLSSIKFKDLPPLQ